jgi:hypothetical protein
MEQYLTKVAFSRIYRCDEIIPDYLIKNIFCYIISSLKFTKYWEYSVS